MLSPKNEQRKMNLGLSRIKNALVELNNPSSNIPAIQIIGTNGKGSITAFLENIICSSDLKVGATTSPHLIEINERIRVNKINIKTSDLEKLLKRIRKIAHDFQLSPFEELICCGLLYFDHRDTDLLLLEAGLGGRLDATTAHKLRPIIAIGKIGIDHKEYLGESLREITKEKVAVIEKDSHVVTCIQTKIVDEIISARVKKVNAKISWVKPLSKDWELGLKGDFQRYNAAVANGVIQILYDMGLIIDKNIVRRGLATTKWPGRLEMLDWDNKKVLVDSAHNHCGAIALAAERKKWPNQEKGVYWIFGVQKQKDLQSILKTLIMPLDTVLLVPVPNQKSWTLKDAHIFKFKYIERIIEFNSFQNALYYLDEQKVWPKFIPVLTGSIFLVAEFMKFARSH